MFFIRNNSILETDFLEKEKTNFNVNFGPLENFGDICFEVLASKSDIFNVQIQVFVKIIK